MHGWPGVPASPSLDSSCPIVAASFQRPLDKLIIPRILTRATPSSEASSGRVVPIFAAEGQ